MLMREMRRTMQAIERKGKVTPVIYQHNDGVYVFKCFRVSGGYVFLNNDSGSVKSSHTRVPFFQRS